MARGRALDRDTGGRAPAWEINTVRSLAGGMNTRIGDDFIEDEEVAYCDGARMVGSALIGETGYSRLGGLVRGKPKGAFSHQTAAGITTLLLITDVTVYRYVAVVAQWQYVSSGVATTLSANASGADTVLNVVSSAGFAAADFIGLLLNTGIQHQAVVLSVGAGTITLTAALPGSGVIATSGNAVVKAKLLTGTDDKQVVIVPVPSNQWTAFTNGVDVPQRYDGSTVEAIPDLGTKVCLTMAMFRDGYLVLGGMTEGGTPFPYRVRWCAIGNPTNWTTGDSGFNDLLDSRDGVVGMKPLAGQLIVYRSKSFVWMEFAVGGSTPFTFRPVNFGESIGTQGIGVVSPNAIFATDDSHIVFDSRGIYVYRGGFSVERISDPIHNTIFGVGGAADTSKFFRVFLWYSDRTSELYCMYSVYQEDFPRQAAVYNIEERTWRLRSFSHQMTASGIREGSDSLPWVIPFTANAWSSYGGSWASGATTGLARDILLLPALASNAPVYRYDYISTSDDGVLILSPFVRTKRFRGGDRFMLHDWVELEYFGPAISVYLRSDDTSSFVLIGQLPARTTLGRGRIYFQSVQESIQYQIIGELSAGIVINSLAFKWKEASRWSL